MFPCQHSTEQNNPQGSWLPRAAAEGNPQVPGAQGEGQSLTSSQIGRFISFSTWQALVVTELTPEHHSTENSQGSFTTYKLTEMLSWRYCLHGDSCSQSHTASFWLQLCSKNAPWVSTRVCLFCVYIPKKPRRESDLGANLSP
uniref:Uncharacterized protein n=1 Tax=Falco tinnunculus TaxID=100819 RepID=A0A8C4UVY4_FALTI